jgi:hypothetical protein
LKEEAMFDPENVERFEPEQYNDYGHLGGSVLVLACDYDQLLEIHLRHVDMIASLFSRCGEPLSEEKIASLKNGTWR